MSHDNWQARGGKVLRDSRPRQIVPIEPRDVLDIRRERKIFELGFRVGDDQLCLQGLRTVQDPLPAGAHHGRLNRFDGTSQAYRARLSVRQGISYDAGGVIPSYGANFSDLYYRAASYVDRILQGG